MWPGRQLYNTEKDLDARDLYVWSPQGQVPCCLLPIVVEGHNPHWSFVAWGYDRLRIYKGTWGGVQWRLRNLELRELLRVWGLQSTLIPICESPVSCP